MIVNVRVRDCDVELGESRLRKSLHVDKPKQSENERDRQTTREYFLAHRVAQQNWARHVALATVCCGFHPRLAQRARCALASDTTTLCGSSLGPQVGDL